MKRNQKKGSQRKAKSRKIRNRNKRVSNPTYKWEPPTVPEPVFIEEIDNGDGTVSYTWAIFTEK
jgi:hypothetical protein